MIHVFHTPTGWKVCQEYPEGGRPQGWASDYTEPISGAAKYDQAAALSIANAVDVREEDQDWVKHKVFFRGKDWKPDDNQVYALPDLDVEIKLQGRPKGSKKWMDESNLISPVSNWESRKLAHVFRKKEEKAGRPEDFPWPAKEEPVEESQDELWQIIQEEMIEDFKWPKDLLELLKSKFHLTRVKAELKGEKK